jgi:5'-nucleotidase / UDP-sugar diphosphatase
MMCADINTREKGEIGMKKARQKWLWMAILSAALLLVAGYASALDTVVAEAEVDLDGEREHVRTRETNLGNLIADMMAEITGADLAITNGGGIRASIPQGPVTLEAVLEVHPFSNTIVTLEMTGQQIHDAIEHAVSQYPDQWGGFPQVSGISFVFDPDQPAGERVVEILHNGAALDLSASYLVATNDFLASGGDDFSMMADAVPQQEFMSLEAAMVQYFQDHTPLSPQVEDRITTR